MSVFNRGNLPSRSNRLLLAIDFISRNMHRFGSWLYLLILVLNSWIMEFIGSVSTVINGYGMSVSIAKEWSLTAVSTCLNSTTLLSATIYFEYSSSASEDSHPTEWFSKRKSSSSTMSSNPLNSCKELLRTRSRRLPRLSVNLISNVKLS